MSPSSSSFRSSSKTMTTTTAAAATTSIDGNNDDRIFVVPADDAVCDDDFLHVANCHLEILKTTDSFPQICGSNTTQFATIKSQNNSDLRLSLEALQPLIESQLLAVPSYSPRYFLEMQIGSRKVRPLYDLGSNISIIHQHLLTELESSGGRFAYSASLPFRVEDHQHNTVPTSNIVEIPVFTLQTSIVIPFVVQLSSEIPKKDSDLILLGANFCNGVQAALEWENNDLFMSIQGRPETRTKLIRESGSIFLSQLQLTARSIDAISLLPPLARVEPITTSPATASTCAASALPSSTISNVDENSCLGQDSNQHLTDNADQDTPAYGPDQDLINSDPNQQGPLPDNLGQIQSTLPILPDKVPSSWREIINLNDIPSEHRLFMENWFDTFSCILSLHAADVGFVDDDRFRFPLNIDPDFVLPTCKPYPASPEACNMIKTICEQWLRLELTEPSTSVGCVPSFLVSKRIPAGANKNHNLILAKRLVCDLRLPNAHTRSWPNKLPHIHYITDALVGSCWLSKFDLANAYQNFEVREADRHHLSFVTATGDVYQFRRLPYGLKNAPSFFQHCLSVMLAPIHESCLVYLDDILLFSKTEEEHKQLLHKFGEIMKSFSLKISPKKCLFWQREVEFLSFKVNGRGIALSEEKVKAIRDYERPKTAKQVAAFLGAANWMSRFVAGFQHMAAPLSDLLKKDQKFNWSDECEESFQRLKQGIISATHLTHPRFDATFHLFCDASRLALGGALMQQDGQSPGEDGDGDNDDDGAPAIDKLLPVAFHSRKFSDTQKRYSSLELECLSIIDNLEHFRYYIAHAPKVIVYTDARTILYLLSHNFNSANRKLERYSMLLLAYDNISVRHYPGHLNVLADALSRQHDGCDQPPPRISVKEAKKEDISYVPPDKDVSLDCMLRYLQENPTSVRTVTVTTSDVVRSQQIAGFFRNFTTTYLMKSQARDPWCQQIIEDLLKQPGHENDKFHFTRNLLVRKAKDNAIERIVVPKDCESLVLAYMHSHGHVGWRRLYVMLSQYFYFRGAVQACKSFAQGCSICQQQNRHKTGLQETTNMLLPTKVNHCWSIDFMQVSKHNKLEHILNVQDDFSGFVVSFPTPSQKATQVVKALRWCFSILGVPELLRADHGRSLESTPVKKLCAEWGVKRISYGIPNQPTKNARVERTHQSIRGILKALSEQFGTNFKEVLPLANYVYNSTPHRIGSVTPYECFTGRRIRIAFPSLDDHPESMRDHLRSSQRPT
jgi:hypothetical protein